MQLQKLLEVLDTVDIPKKHITSGKQYYIFQTVIDANEIYVDFSLHRQQDNNNLWIFLFKVNEKMMLLKNTPLALTLKIMKYVLSCVEHVKAKSNCKVFCLAADDDHTAAYSSFLPRLAAKYQMIVKQIEGSPYNTFYLTPTNNEPENKQSMLTKLTGK